VKALTTRILELLNKNRNCQRDPVNISIVLKEDVARVKRTLQRMARKGTIQKDEFEVVRKLTTYGAKESKPQLTVVQGTFETVGRRPK
jgi:hypothetical protein